jgi:hypothetical protein
MYLPASIVSILLTLIPTIPIQFLPHSSTTKPPPQQQNAFRIFNAIHSSMRQWGSSLNHNGVSYFPATVPKDTELYHGTRTDVPVTGIQWLAFEPEHALHFARQRRRRPPPDDRSSVPYANAKQKPVKLDPEEGELGFLHTYTTNKELHLLYIDGMSAGKTSNGTLDSQDFVILNYTNGDEGLGFRDGDRAQALCKVAAHDWKGRVDGFIRLEAGFEIILCDFGKDLDVKRITRVGTSCKRGFECGIGMEIGKC